MRWAWLQCWDRQVEQVELASEKAAAASRTEKAEMERLIYEANVHSSRIEREGIRLREELEMAKESRREHALAKYNMDRMRNRAVAKHEELRSNSLHLAAETDARFRKFLESEPRPAQKHLADLIDRQLRVAENKSGRCVWPTAILDWCACSLLVKTYTLPS